MDRDFELLADCYNEKKLKLPQSLHSILQVLSLTLFERTNIGNLLGGLNSNDLPNTNPNQLIIFDF